MRRTLFFICLFLTGLVVTLTIHEPNAFTIICTAICGYNLGGIVEINKWRARA